LIKYNFKIWGFGSFWAPHIFETLRDATNVWEH